MKFSQKLLEFLEFDETANNSFLHLSTAWQLQSTSGSKPLQRSILQHYVLSMEAIINGTMSEVRKARQDAIKLEEQKFSNEFSSELPKRADKAKAIREASTKLREISLTNMVPSIEIVGPLLALPDNVRWDAKDLYRLRSRTLSHPGKKDAEEMEQWLKRGPQIQDFCLAETVARYFLLAYCRHSISNAKN